MSHIVCVGVVANIAEFQNWKEVKGICIWNLEVITTYLTICCLSRVWLLCPFISHFVCRIVLIFFLRFSFHAAGNTTITITLSTFKQFRYYDAVSFFRGWFLHYQNFWFKISTFAQASKVFETFRHPSLWRLVFTKFSVLIYFYKATKSNVAHTL